MSTSAKPSEVGPLPDRADVRLALVGSPNAGKTTLFNALTGLRAKTGNYPGVTVSRYDGVCEIGGQRVVIEDLPGSYSLDPISPDERVLAEVVDPHHTQVQTPQGLLVALDATTLPRSLRMLAQVLRTGLPVVVVLTFTDELTRRQGAVVESALARAVGVPVVSVSSGRRGDMAVLKELMVRPESWPRPVVLPSDDPAEVSSWIDSVLTTAGYRLPEVDARTRGSLRRVRSRCLCLTPRRRSCARSARSFW